MSIFSSILSRVFGTPAASATPPPADTAVLAAPAEPQVAAGQASAISATALTAQLNALAAANSQKLQWQTSIVDLMKLVGIDSSLQARQALAQELHYAGDMAESATMNTWLQVEVMQRLAENGGAVPAALRD